MREIIQKHDKSKMQLKVLKCQYGYQVAEIQLTMLARESYLNNVDLRDSVYQVFSARRVILWYILKYTSNINYRDIICVDNRGEQTVDFGKSLVINSENGS